MAFQIFNTLTRKVETFVPVNESGRKVGMYCCGPTIYDFGHIGNFRTFVFADFLRRYLEFLEYEVTFVMNITDVEDKIIQRLRTSGQSLKEYTSRYESAFLEDMAVLGCLNPHRMPRATDHIPDIVRLIGMLMDRGLAYQATDGSVYFSIEKYQGSGSRYGQLLNLNFDQMRPGSRVASDEYDKESVADFALWKARVPQDGKVFWTSPWGEGRPGWHIECSAMSMKELGSSFDLHVGGEDLIFPHHEDEIAQSEGSGLQKEGEHFVKYWMHVAHLLVEGKKMSKSLGNFFTLRELLERGFEGREVRWLLLSSHYRETFNFTLEGLQGARQALARLDECIEKVQNLTEKTEAVAEGELVRSFTRALDDDLNVAAAWGAIFEWVRETNRKLASKDVNAVQAAALLADWKKVEKVLGMSKPHRDRYVPREMMDLLQARQEARRDKDFSKADAIRDELKARGWMIDDTPEGPKLKPI